MSMEAAQHYSAREAARILQTTEAQVRAWARAGGIVPEPGASGSPEFTFQQLLLLRTTRGLYEAGVPPGQVRRVWASLRRQLTDDLPLTSIRILADGRRAVAWDGHAPWQPDSGQFVLDFDAGEIAERAGVTEESKVATLSMVVPLATEEKPVVSAAGPEPEPASLTAEQWFHIACELDGISPLEAQHAYLQALRMDPEYADAHVNLGRLLHEAGELGRAEAYYRKAAEHAPDDSTIPYNLAVLLEDRGRPEEAILAYRRAIEVDAEAADAHYNLGLLLDSLGRRSEAMRHLMTARQLYAGSHGGR
jgi:DNA-binding transcriptional MerR regulator